MLLRVVASVLLALIGMVVPAAGSPDQQTAALPADRVVGQPSALAEFAAAALRASAAEPVVEPPAPVEVTTVDVVVPALDPAGDVVASPDLTAADAAPDALATDELAGDRVVSEVLESDGFQTLGVTWPGGTDVTGLAPQVRTRAGDGSWSAWQDLEISDSAPDAGTADAATSATRGGTDALWVGESTAVQVSFAADPSAGPDGLELALVDVPAVSGAQADTVGAAWSGEATVVPAVAGLPAAVSQPRIITREEWGAAP